MILQPLDIINKGYLNTTLTREDYDNFKLLF